MGPGAYAKVVEIMSGRAMWQQGLVATCKDPEADGTTGGRGSRMVGRMSPYERRRGGNAPRGAPREHPAGYANAAAGKRALGTRLFRRDRRHPDIDLEPMSLFRHPLTGLCPGGGRKGWPYRDREVMVQERRPRLPAAAVETAWPILRDGARGDDPAELSTLRGDDLLPAQ
jgi:hypothetical protein